MIDSSFITKTEREIMAIYDREHQKRLLLLLLPAFIVICLVVSVLILAFLVGHATILGALPFQQNIAMGLTVAYLLGLSAILWGSIILTKRDKLFIPSLTIITSSILGTSLALVLWSSIQGLDPFGIAELTPFSVAIVVSGMISDMWLTYLVTVVMNIITIAVLLWMPKNPATSNIISHEFILIIGISLIYEWLFAILVIIFRRVLRDIISRVGVAYERAKQLDTLKEEFIASVNHELRTPLMTMQMYLETIRDGHHDMTSDQIQEALNQICNVEDSLVDMVKSILAVRHIDQESADIILIPVPLLQLIQEATTLIDPREGNLVQRPLHLHIAAEISVMGDKVRLLQVFTNLLSNAIKYSKPGTPIEISASILPKSNNHQLVEITIRDYGFGIPPEQIAFLFNRFVRLPRDLASNIMGNGLGLYLCRVMIDAMQGKIWVESEGIPDRGSTFHIQLLQSPIHQITSQVTAVRAHA